MLSDLQAVPAFAALGHRIRLDAFRLLVKAGPSGLPSGEIAAELGVSPTATSFHLTTLERAGLASARRDGRNVLYAANFERMRALIVFLTADCCGGRPEICEGLVASGDAGCGCEGGAENV